jgi:hypothetical protein
MYNRPMNRKSFEFDVALSFAGEDRAYVSEVAAALRENGISVFYDEFETVGLWGRDLYSHLDSVYRTAARYCIMFVSDSYATKVWTNHERRSAQARALTENREYVLPARFDDTEIEGLLSTIGYVDLKVLSPVELAVMVLEKLGPREVEEGFPSNPDVLWNNLEVDDGDADEQKRVAKVSEAFFRALSRMNYHERLAVCGILAFGCSAELPEQVHISLDLLSRMIGRSTDNILNDLAAVRALNVKVATRELLHEPEPGDLILEDDRDLVLSFWAHSEEDQDDSTEIAYATVQSAAQHYCEDHGLEVVVRLDFRRLSSDFQSSLILPDLEH